MSNTADISLVRRVIINWTAIKGDSFASGPVSFTIGGVDEDFSGATIEMKVYGDQNQVIATLTVGDGITVADNVLQYLIDADTTGEWATGDYRYDVKKNVSGIVKTIQAGTITLIQ